MRDFLYCLFFPHPSNNHRAKILHHKTLLLIISFFVFGSFFFSSALNPFGNKIKAFAEVSVRELIQFTNQKRQDNGLPPLSENAALATAASNKADDMFSKDYWAHNSPDGTTPWIFIKQAGYDYVYAGENLARGFNSASDVVNAWMASPDHRTNLLSPNFKDVGFAVKQGKLNGENTMLVVEEFGNKNIVSDSAIPQNTGVKKVLGFNLSPYLINKPSFSISSKITISLMVAFLTVLLIDIIIVKRKKIVRFSGHSLDHAFFLFLIILIIALFNMGVIL